MPGDPRLRASDRDRERVASLLQEHHAQGRLTAEEFHERLELAYQAKTMGELDALQADLPAIDLYRLPSASIRPARRDGGGVDRRGRFLSAEVAAWGAWSGAGFALFILWLGVGLVIGGAAWLPWFLAIVVPWAIVLSRR